MTRAEAFRYLLGRAAEQGVEVEVLSNESRELSIDAFEGSVSELKRANRAGVGVRAMVDGRIGYAWTEELEQQALDWILAEACENALLQDEGEGVLPPGSAHGKTDLLSEGLSAPVERKAERALELERELRGHEKFSRISTARYMERESSQAVVSSLGMEGEYRSGFSGLLASFVMRDGDSVKQGMELDASQEFHSLDPGRTAQHMLQRTGRLLGARPLATGRYRAYLEPMVVADLLRVLEFALSGKTLIERKSRFEGKLGQRVASELVTIVDDPAHPEGLGNRPFDSEGTATPELTLIERGVLTSFLHNSATAREAGHPNTGHASRTYRSTLGVSPTNLLLLPGAGIVPEDGVIVTELMGLHAGANPISGDVSLQGFGLRIEDGESYPVENFVMSGNLFALFERVSAVGDSAEWTHAAGVLAPMIEVESLSFGGA